jgi:hypothetical protein
MEALGRVVKYLVGVWTLFVGGTGLLFCMFHGRGDGFAAFCVLLVGMAPLALLIWAGQARKARWARVHADMIAAAGIGPGDFQHAEDDSGIALNREARALTLLDAGQWKTYPFDDVRGWKAYLIKPGQAGMVGGNLGSAVAAMSAEANMKRDAKAGTGLFVEVRDVERARWRVAMKDERAQARWMEILRQEINEAAGAGAGHAHA